MVGWGWGISLYFSFWGQNGHIVESLCAHVLQSLLWQRSSSQTLAEADG